MLFLGQISFILFILSSHAFASVKLFTAWFPEYGFIFKRIMQENCQSEYKFYQNKHPSYEYWYDTSRWIGAGREVPEERIVPLVECILGNSSEFIKSDMASANVLLGLAPGILATLGCSIDETAVLSMVGKRRVLSFLIATASPAVMTLRSFAPNSPLDTLKSRDGVLLPDIFSGRIGKLIAIAEYPIVLAALANTIELCLRLGYRTVVALLPGYPFAVIVWALFGPIPHCIAALALRIRLQVVNNELLPDKSLRAFLARLKQEILGNSMKYSLPISVTLNHGNLSKSKRFWFFFLSCSLPLLTASHVIFGTVVLSSMIFISARDAIAILGRFMASVIVCRIMVWYELTKMRALYNSKQDLSSSIEMQTYHQVKGISA